MTDIQAGMLYFCFVIVLISFAGGFCKAIWEDGRDNGPHK